MLGVVLELFIVEEKLLACRENKLGAAVNALQDSIGEFHGRLPSQGLPPKSAMALQDLAGRGSLMSFVVHYKGPDRPKLGRHSNFCPRVRATSHFPRQTRGQ